MSLSICLSFEIFKDVYTQRKSQEGLHSFCPKCHWRVQQRSCVTSHWWQRWKQNMTCRDWLLIWPHRESESIPNILPGSHPTWSNQDFFVTLNSSSLRKPLKLHSGEGGILDLETWIQFDNICWDHVHCWVPGSCDKSKGCVKWQRWGPAYVQG